MRLRNVAFTWGTVATGPGASDPDDRAGVGDGSRSLLRPLEGEAVTHMSVDEQQPCINRRHDIASDRV